MLYEIGVTSMAGTTGTANWTLITASTPGRARLMEFGSFNQAATASLFGLGRPAANGATPTTTSNMQPQDPNDVVAASTLLVTISGNTWTTVPTIPSPFLRVWGTGAAIGSGVIWTWPRGLVLPVTGNLVEWCSGTNSVQSVYNVVEI